jgi:urea ABC transporter permease protein UrtB
MESVLIQSLNGMSFIAILALIGVGLAVLLGMMGVINLAHGEFVMLGAFVVWASGSVVHNFWIGAVIAVIIVSFFGLLVERTLIRVLYQRPLDTILATWGLGIIIRELAQLVFGKSDKMVEAPFPGFISFWGIQYSAYRLFVIAMAILILAAVVLFFLNTNYGLKARVVMFNREMASALGVNTVRTNQSMFVLGAGLAGLAGALISPIYVNSAYMGLEWLVGSFFVVVIGGVGSIFSPIGGAIVMGGSQGAAEYFLSPVAAKIIILVIAIIAVRLNPRGLFAHS